MPYISQSTIEDVLETDIVEILRDYVSLEKKGVNYVGLCPFHDEKTPSFTVSPSKGIYKCFGCGAGGNVISFVKKFKNVEFVEAVEIIANKQNIIVDYEGGDVEEYKKQKSRQEQLFELNNIVKDYFKIQLQKNPAPLNYLLDERKISPEMIKKYEIGFSPFSKTALFNYLKINYSSSIEDAKELGLLIDHYDRPFDRFSSRIIFPIKNIRGNIVGFSGRHFSENAVNNKKFAKYLNSPESEIFHKSKELYGLHENLNEIRKQKKVYLQEGYTDLIAMDQLGLIKNGFPSVVSMGTSLTTDQIKLLKKIVNEVVILLDGDPAGLKASERGVRLFLEGDLKTEITILPEGEDPDSFVRKSTNPADALRNLGKLTPYAFIKSNEERKLKKPFEKFSPDEKYSLLKHSMELLISNKNHARNFLWLEKLKEDFSALALPEVYSKLLSQYEKLHVKEKSFKELRILYENNMSIIIPHQKDVLISDKESRLISYYLQSTELVAQTIENEFLNRGVLSKDGNSMLEFIAKERHGPSKNEFPLTKRNLFSLSNKFSGKLQTKFLNYFRGYLAYTALDFFFDDGTQKLNPLEEMRLHSKTVQVSKLTKELHQATKEKNRTLEEKILQQLKRLGYELRKQ